MRHIHTLLILTLLSTQIINSNQNYTDEYEDAHCTTHLIDDSVQSTHSALHNMKESIRESIALLLHYIQSLIKTEPTHEISEETIRALLIHRNETQQPNSRKERIIAHIARIINGIFNIARDPHNAHNVGDSVGTMVQGIISITVDAIKDKKERQLVRSHLEKACDEVTQEINKLFENHTLE